MAKLPIEQPGRVITLEDLTAWESRSGLRLPDSLRELILEHGGSRLSAYLSADIPGQGRTSHLSVLALEGPSSIEAARALDGMPRNAVPFMRDGVGNFFAISSADGDVYFFDHDTAELVRVSPAAKFLASLESQRRPEETSAELSPQKALAAGMPLAEAQARYEPSPDLLRDAIAAGRRDLVEWLLDRGVRRQGALALATKSTEILAVLLERGADLNERGPEGRTALMHASLTGRMEAVQLLLAKGADRTLRDQSGKSASDLALLGRRETIHRLLSEGS